MTYTLKPSTFIAATVLAFVSALYPVVAIANETNLLSQVEPSAVEPPQPDPLSQIRAEHIMISTANYDETIEWYTRKLGFQVVQEWTVPEFEGVQLAYIELNGFVIEVVSTPEAFQEE